YSTPFTVQRLITTSAGQVDCAPSNCLLFSSDFNLGSVAVAPLEFDPNVPPQPRLELGLTVEPRGTVVSKTGEVTVLGTVTCNLPSDTFIDIFITQRAGRVLIHGESFPTEVSCDGSTAFSATGAGFNGLFKGGSASVYAFAQANSGIQIADAEVITTIK